MPESYTLEEMYTLNPVSDGVAKPMPEKTSYTLEEMYGIETGQDNLPKIGAQQFGMGVGDFMDLLSVAPRMGYAATNTPATEAKFDRKSEFFNPEQLGQTAANVIKETRSQSSPSSFIKKMIEDVSGEIMKPKTTAGERVGDISRFMGAGGFTTPLSSLVSAGAVRATKESGGGEGAQFAAGMLAPITGAKLANVVKPKVTKAGEMLAQKFTQAPVTNQAGDILATTNLPEDVIDIAARSVKRSGSELSDKALKAVKETEAKSVMGIDSGQEAFNLVKGAKSVKGKMGAERQAAASPYFKQAFVNDKGKFIRPQGQDAVDEMAKLGGAEVDGALIGGNSLFLEAKKQTLKKAKPEMIEKGYENSLQHLRDIKNELNEKAITSSVKDPAVSSTFRSLADDVEGIIEKGIPQEGKLALKKANKQWEVFSKKLDSVFGVEQKAKMGQLLNLKEYDAKSQEDVLKKVYSVFESPKMNANLVKQQKKVFDSYGAKDNFTNGWKSFYKQKVNNLGKKTTLRDVVNESENTKQVFQELVPPEFRTKTDKVLNAGDNLYKILEEASKEKGTIKEKVAQFVARGVGAGGGQYSARAAGQIGTEALIGLVDKVKNPKKIDEAIIDILFDPQKGKDFLKNFDKLKNNGSREKFIADYIIKKLPPLVTQPEERELYKGEEDGI